jgi:hypothetical protein
MRRSVLIGSVLLLLVAGFGLNGLAHGAGIHYRVHVDLSADDQIKDRVASDLNRELRSLGDVDVVDAEPNYLLEVVVVHVRNRAGCYAGYAVASASLAHFQNGALLMSVEAKYRDFWKDMTTNLYADPGLWVTVGDNLEELSKEVVTAFDTGKLEPVRKINQQVEDMMKKK